MEPAAVVEDWVVAAAEGVGSRAVRFGAILYLVETERWNECGTLNWWFCWKSGLDVGNFLEVERDTKLEAKAK